MNNLQLNLVASSQKNYYDAKVSKQDKLLQRIQAKPKDFSWAELVTLLHSLGFVVHTGEESSRKFLHPETKAVLMLHEPHPQSILKAYQVRAAVDFLRSEGYLR